MTGKLEGPVTRLKRMGYFRNAECGFVRNQILCLGRCHETKPKNSGGGIRTPDTRIMIPLL